MKKRKLKMPDIPFPWYPDDDYDDDFFLEMLLKDKNYLKLLSRKAIVNDLEELELLINFDIIEYNYLMLGFKGYN
jgi:hypothetical protein